MECYAVFKFDPDEKMWVASTANVDEEAIVSMFDEYGFETEKFDGVAEE